VQKKSFGSSPGKAGYEQKRTSFVSLLSPDENPPSSVEGDTKQLDTPEARGARAAFAIAGQRVRRKKKGIK